jgi:hypothetical protein
MLASSMAEMLILGNALMVDQKEIEEEDRQ